MAKQDGELSSWLIVGGVFTLTLIGIDIGYSSYGSMEEFLKGVIILLHFIIGLGWVIEMIKFNDPNFDWLRHGIVWCSVIGILLVGLQHATSREDKQVLIDSKANADKQRIEDSLYKVKYGIRVIMPNFKDTVK